MPKKTRQEKILAQLRRLQQQTSQSETLSSDKIPSLSTVVKQVQTKEATSPKAQVMDYGYVFGDLRKTLLFALLAVIFELILSLTALGSYVKLFFRLF